MESVGNEELRAHVCAGAVPTVSAPAEQAMRKRLKRSLCTFLASRGMDNHRLRVVLKLTLIFFRIVAFWAKSLRGQ